MSFWNIGTTVSAVHEVFQDNNSSTSIGESIPVSNFSTDSLRYILRRQSHGISLTSLKASSTMTNRPQIALTSCEMSSLTESRRT